MTFSILIDVYINTKCATERHRHGLVSVGWMVSCNTSAQIWKKEKVSLVPPNKNNRFNYYGCAMVQPQHGWWDPAEVALATGDGDKVWAGLQGNYRVVWRMGGNCIRPPVPAVNPESSCLQLSEALSVSSSPSGDNWSCTVCKHVFGLKDKFQSEDLYICPACRGRKKISF